MSPVGVTKVSDRGAPTGTNPQRVSQVYRLRLEYHPDECGLQPEEPRTPPRRGWERVFEVSDKNSLEQLASTILSVLGWEEDHLYQFVIEGRLHAHMGDPDYSDFLVDAGPCVSCAIRLHRLGLTRGVAFAFVFDFGECHHFGLTVLEIVSKAKGKILPAVMSHRGGNLLQYPGTRPRREEREAQRKPPNITTPRPTVASISSCVRFVRGEDKAGLLKWRESNDKRLWDKAVTILENRKFSVERISEKIERSTNVVKSWIGTFNAGGLAALHPPRKERTPGKIEAAFEQRKKRLLEILHDRPRSFDINRASWNLTSLARAYQGRYGEHVSRSSVSRSLRDAGYSIKKARRVLTSPDPEYREKVEQVLGTLQNLQPGELFFFIDELGPLRVQKYGGRMFTRNGETPTVPQVQPHKGSITLAGALSATANQVTWLYASAKDTLSMIDLIEVLFNQHINARRIFLTWDAASWHRSAMLVDWLDTFNVGTTASGIGPIIQLVPLPTSSQFLDVLESVFSGMKKAVVHNSDYQSTNEMKTAISRHFVERNLYFRENPRRAGKKIWEVDFFQDTNNLRSGTYREW